MDKDSEYVKAAKFFYHEDGTCEVDDDAEVSRVVDGAYVQAWVWVSNNDLSKAETRESK